MDVDDELDAQEEFQWNLLRSQGVPEEDIERSKKAKKCKEEGDQLLFEKFYFVV